MIEFLFTAVAAAALSALCVYAAAEAFDKLGVVKFATPVPAPHWHAPIHAAPALRVMTASIVVVAVISTNPCPVIGGLQLGTPGKVTSAKVRANG